MKKIFSKDLWSFSRYIAHGVADFRTIARSEFARSKIKVKGHLGDKCKWGGAAIIGNVVLSGTRVRNLKGSHDRTIALDQIGKWCWVCTI